MADGQAAGVVMLQPVVAAVLVQGELELAAAAQDDKAGPGQWEEP